MRENYINVGRIRRARRQTKHRVIFIVISAFVIFGLSLLLGYYLRTQVDTMPQRGDIPAEMLSGQLPADTSDASKISIMAPDLPLDGIPDDAAVAAAVENLVLDSREAVSICLRDDAGEVYYRSSVAKNLTGQQAEGVDLALLIPALRNANIYTSAMFGVTAFASPGTGEGDLLYAYESSLIAEIGASGVDEILLTGLPVTVDTLDAVSAFLGETRRQLPDGVQLAVAVPAALTAEAAGSVLIKQLSQYADTIALDLRGLTAAEGQSPADAAAAIFTDASLYFSKYNMRVLLPVADRETFSALRQSMELNGIHNWQSAH